MAKTLTLRNIPQEIYQFLLDEQAKEKLMRGNGMFSLESTVYKILKNCARCREKEIPKPIK